MSARVAVGDREIASSFYLYRANHSSRCWLVLLSAKYSVFRCSILHTVTSLLTGLYSLSLSVVLQVHPDNFEVFFCLSHPKGGCRDLVRVLRAARVPLSWTRLLVGAVSLYSTQHYLTLRGGEEFCVKSDHSCQGVREPIKFELTDKTAF